MAPQVPPKLQPSLVTTSLLVISIVFPILSTFAVALRFYVKYLKNRKIFLDDCVITFALLFAWGVSINCFVTARLAGVNYTTLDHNLAGAFFSRTTWVESIPLVVSLILVKIAIALFYNRIFTIPVFRIAVWVYIGILIAAGIAICVTFLLVRNPITSTGSLSVKATFRYNYFAFMIASSCISFVFDVMVLCFPLPIIRKLRMPWKRKLQVIGIFWLGIFCCVASAIRLYYVGSSTTQMTRGTPTESDQTYIAITSVFMWGVVEPNVSIVAACLPTYGPLFDTTRSAKHGEGCRCSAKKPTIQIQRSERFPSESTNSSRQWQHPDDNNHGFNFNIQVTTSPYDDSVALSMDPDAHQVSAGSTRPAT